MSTAVSSQWPRQFASVAGGFVLLLGAVVLLAWTANIEPLKSVVPGWPKMSPLTALAFTLCGVTLSCAATRPPRRQSYRMIAQVGAGLVTLIGLAWLCDHVFGWNLGLDLLWYDVTDDSAPAAMAPGTAVNFILLGFALLFASSHWFPTPFQVLAVSAGLLGWLGLSRYLFGGAPLFPLAQMAAHTATSFVILSAGVLSSRPDIGLAALLVSDSAGGTAVRRLLPAAMIAPFVFGWLRLQAQRAGWFGLEGGLSLFALSNAIVFGALAWIHGHRLHRSEIQRKQAEEARRASQQLLESIVNNSTTVIYVKDLAGRYLLVNRRYEQLFHVTQAGILGKTDHDMFPKAAADDFRRVDQQVATSGELIEAEEIAPHDDGPHTYISIKFPLRDGEGSVFAVGGISTDITDRKNGEDALRASEARLRTLAESLPHLVWTCSPDGQCDYLSRQWVDYTGRPAEEQLGYGWAEQLHPDDREQVQAAWAEATKRGDQFDVEFRIRRGDGDYRWFKTRAVPLRDSTGQIVKWFGSNTDFDDNKRAEQKLQTHLERLALLSQLTRAIGERQDLRSIFQVVVRDVEENLPLDFGCICLYDSADQTLTVTCVGAKSRPLALDLAMPEKARVAIDQNGLSRCVRGQLVHEPDLDEVQFPFPQRLRRGGLRALVAAPLRVESNVFGVLVAARRDARSFSSADCEFLRQLSEHVALAAHQAQISGALQRAYDDLRQTQQAIMQQERLRALGQMASGIAHDINNAISPVSLYIESLLEKEPGLSPKAREYLTTIQHAMDDVAQTVSRMREFYRQREPQLTLAAVHLNRLVDQVVELTRARWSDIPQQRGVVIELRKELDAALPPIMGVESEIREALINLIFNAVDAMSDGGGLTLRTACTAARTGNGEASPAIVCIEVTDTGVGMSEETRRRCLEPFYTTKGERGTGLGLAMVYGTVQRHGAEIEIDSMLGRGTTMRLLFPLPAALVESPTAPPTTSQPPSRLRLLVIDDDPVLLKSLHETLEGDGHKITVAGGGKAGIEAFRDAQRTGRPFAAVITDLGMPHVDGRHVASAIKTSSPDTPVILLTGWGQRMVAEGEIPPHVDRVLNKPPKLRELREALASIPPSAHS